MPIADCRLSVAVEIDLSGLLAHVNAGLGQFQKWCNRERRHRDRLGFPAHDHLSTRKAGVLGWRSTGVGSRDERRLSSRRACGMVKSPHIVTVWGPRQSNGSDSRQCRGRGDTHEEATADSGLCGIAERHGVCQRRDNDGIHRRLEVRREGRKRQRGSVLEEVHRGGREAGFRQRRQQGTA